MTRKRSDALNLSKKPSHLAEESVPSTAGSASVIKTAGRVFEVLEYMREQRRPVTVRMVAERLGYPKSSALVLLKSMAVLGYLRYDLESRSFFGTPRLAALGDWVLDSMQLGSRFLSVIEDIARATQETTILAIDNDIYAQYVHVVLAGRTIQYYVQPGTRRLLAMSGLGWALLSTRNEDEIRRIVERTNVRLAGSNQSVNLDVVMQHIQDTRSRGYAFSRGTVTEGIGVIAMPLPKTETGDRLAIGVGGFVERLDQACDSVVRVMKTHLITPL